MVISLDWSIRAGSMSAVKEEGEERREERAVEDRTTVVFRECKKES